MMDVGAIGIGEESVELAMLRSQPMQKEGRVREGRNWCLHVSLFRTCPARIASLFEPTDRI
jgi:hypothetical protein